MLAVLPAVSGAAFLPSPAVSADAFELLHLVCAKRLAAGRLTVIDATNVRHESRKPFIEMARNYHVQPVAVVFSSGSVTSVTRPASS